MTPGKIRFLEVILQNNFFDLETLGLCNKRKKGHAAGEIFFKKLQGKILFQRIAPIVRLFPAEGV